MEKEGLCISYYLRVSKLITDRHKQMSKQHLKLIIGMIFGMSLRISTNDITQHTVETFTGLKKKLAKLSQYRDCTCDIVGDWIDKEHHKSHVLVCSICTR